MGTYETKTLSGPTRKRVARSRTGTRSNTSAGRTDMKIRRGKGEACLVVPNKSLKVSPKEKVVIREVTLKEQVDSKLRQLRRAQLNHLVGSWEPSSPDQWVDIIHNGVPVRSVGKFAKNIGLQKDVMFSIIHLSRSTAHRLEQKNEVMDTLRSDAFAGAYAVIQKARKMLSSEEALRQWLNTPIPALDSKAPIEWLDTNQGRQIVSSLLDQVQSGAYA